MTFYAHTSQNPDGSPADKKLWEPLFSPSCKALVGQPCPDCESLHPQHGHLNKVAHLAEKFAAEMFPEGPDREAAKQWGYLAGLSHDLGKYTFAYNHPLPSKGSSYKVGAFKQFDHATNPISHHLKA